MKRINYWLTDMQVKGLKQLSKRTELTVSELIRRAVDAYLKQEGGNG